MDRDDDRHGRFIGGSADRLRAMTRKPVKNKRVSAQNVQKQRRSAQNADDTDHSLDCSGWECAPRSNTHEIRHLGEPAVSYLFALDYAEICPVVLHSNSDP